MAPIEVDEVDSPIVEANGDALSPLITDPSALRAEHRRRRDPNEYTRVHPADVEKTVLEGWEFDRTLSASVRLKRAKPKDRLLEDRVWCLFFRMGYPVLSGQNFRLRYERHNRSTDVKKVDVLAKDSETVMIVECKAKDILGKRNLTQDIHEIDNLKGAFANSIRRHFGEQFKPKIVWLIATENIIWNEKDLERAESANIRVITENELAYFETFISHMGSAGRYQFLAEFLRGQEIPHLSGVRVPAVQGSFGPGVKYYSFVTSARHLLKISFVNHQALNHPDGKPAYQRMINKNRIKNIGDFIKRGGFFPTNILLNFVDECRFDPLPKLHNNDKNSKFGVLYLPNKYKSAWVIDGQHRLYGFSDLDDHLLDTNVFVLAFEKLDNTREAEMFITINHEQKSVPKNVLLILQADLKMGSSDPKDAISALASGLVRSLNADNLSPFFQRFAKPGIVPTETQNLTIAEAVKGLVRSGLLGRAVNRKTRVAGYFSAATDADTIKRGRKIINGYFRPLMDANQDRWGAGRAAHVCVNPGIRAHLQIIVETLDYLYAKHILDPQTESPDRLVAALADFVNPVAEFFRSATPKQIELRFARRFGEGGVLQYQYNLIDLIVPKHPDFGSSEYKNYKSDQSDERVSQAARDLEDIQSAVAELCIETLKIVHGNHELPSGEKAYWDIGIESADIKQKAYQKQQSEPSNKRAPREAYIDFVDYIKIIKQTNNWPHLEPLFSIPLPGEKGKKYYLEWIEKVNELRRVTAHKSPYRTFKDDDFETISMLKVELYKRAEAKGYQL